MMHFPMFDAYFMSPPGPTWALRGKANFRSESGSTVDAGLARKQWLAFARAIEAHGGTVIALESPDAALTGMPYAAECGQVVTGDDGRQRFLLPHMAKPHRQKEAPHWKAVAERLGLETVTIDAGYWEAQGDVAHFRDVTLLFHGGRTELAGMEQARPHFSGELLVIETVEPAFHGNMAVLPLPAVDRLVVCPDVIVGDGVDRLRERFGPDALVEIEEADIRAYATNGLPIGDVLLAPTVTPEHIQTRYRELGQRLELLEMSELCEKGGGASRCQVSHARLDDGLRPIPEDLRLEHVARSIEADAG